MLRIERATAAGRHVGLRRRAPRGLRTSMAFLLSPSLYVTDAMVMPAAQKRAWGRKTLFRRRAQEVVLLVLGIKLVCYTYRQPYILVTTRGPTGVYNVDGGQDQHIFDNVKRKLKLPGFVRPKSLNLERERPSCTPAHVRTYALREVRKQV